MTRLPDEMLDIHVALSALSPLERAAKLCVSLIEDDQSPAVILTLISVAARMARSGGLPPNIQTAVLWHLLEAASELDARWN
jgi:hypothetical protein